VGIFPSCIQRYIVSAPIPRILMTSAVEYVFIYRIEYPVRFVKKKLHPDGILLTGPGLEESISFCVKANRELCVDS
jgi:hypothetical protein